MKITNFAISCDVSTCDFVIVCLCTSVWLLSVRRVCRSTCLSVWVADCLSRCMANGTKGKSWRHPWPVAKFFFRCCLDHDICYNEMGCKEANPAFHVAYKHAKSATGDAIVQCKWCHVDTRTVITSIIVSQCIAIFDRYLFRDFTVEMGHTWLHKVTCSYIICNILWSK